MAGSPDPIFVNLAVGQFWLQEGKEFTRTETGFDTGERTWLTRKETPESSYPQIAAPDSVYLGMFVARVIPRDLDCQLTELTVSYRGLIGFAAKAEVHTDDVETICYNLPAVNDGRNTRYVARVPMPTHRREYVTTTAPTQVGVGAASIESFLPTPPSYTLTFTTDPNEPVTLNLVTGWILESRSWSKLGIPSWEVTERYTYLYNIAAG